MTLKVYTEKTSDSWEKVLASFPPASYTIYHTPQYVLSWRHYETGRPVCLHLKVGQTNFLYAFYQKPVPGPSESGLSDIESPYGHGGLVCDKPDPDPNLLVEINTAIDNWCIHENIVAEFVREYPGRPYLRDTSKTLVRENLFHVYSPDRNFVESIKKRARRDASVAKRRGCTAAVTRGVEGLHFFEQLYSGFCQEKGVSNSHDFGACYFTGVREHLSSKALLVKVLHDGLTMASSLAFIHNKCLIYHLSASLPAGKAMLANDLLLYTLLEFGAGEGCECAFLGGGLTSHPADSLYQFKEKFATGHASTHIGTKVHNRPAYERLCADWSRQNPDKASRFHNFFLKYRI